MHHTKLWALRIAYEILVFSAMNGSTDEREDAKKRLMLTKMMVSSTETFETLRISTAGVLSKRFPGLLYWLSEYPENDTPFRMSDGSVITRLKYDKMTRFSPSYSRISSGSRPNISAIRPRVLTKKEAETIRNHMISVASDIFVNYNKRVRYLKYLCLFCMCHDCGLELKSAYRLYRYEDMVYQTSIGLLREKVDARVSELVERFGLKQIDLRASNIAKVFRDITSECGIDTNVKCGGFGTLCRMSYAHNLIKNGAPQKHIEWAVGERKRMKTDLRVILAYDRDFLPPLMLKITGYLPGLPETGDRE